MFTPDPLDSVYQPQSTPIQEEHEQCKCSDEPARKIHAQVMMAMADNAGQLRLQESLTAFKRQSRFGLSPQHSDKPFVLTNMWLFDGEQTRLQTGLSLRDRKSTRLNSSHVAISYAVFCLKKKKKRQKHIVHDQQ